MTEDEMVGWHHQLNGHEFEQTPRAGEGQPGMLQSMGTEQKHESLWDRHGPGFLKPCTQAACLSLGLDLPQLEPEGIFSGGKLRTHVWTK